MILTAEIIPLKLLQNRIEYLRSKNKNLVIVATNGCFDILHIGHVRSLQKAKSLGDILVVGVNSDSSVKKIKGVNRPINNENERVEMLAAFQCIDFISIFNEETAERFLEMVKPNIYVKGNEYDLDNIPEVKVIKKYGGKTLTIPMIGEYSTTNLIGKIKKI